MNQKLTIEITIKREDEVLITSTTTTTDEYLTLKREGPYALTQQIGDLGSKLVAQLFKK